MTTKQTKLNNLITKLNRINKALSTRYKQSTATQRIVNLAKHHEIEIAYLQRGLEA